ncbi:MAG: hypothetical protein Q9170_007749 [Blastenia crenularia]
MLANDAEIAKLKEEMAKIKVKSGLEPRRQVEQEGHHEDADTGGVHLPSGSRPTEKGGVKQGLGKRLKFDEEGVLKKANSKYYSKRNEKRSGKRNTKGNRQTAILLQRPGE